MRSRGSPTSECHQNRVTDRLEFQERKSHPPSISSSRMSLYELRHLLPRMPPLPVINLMKSFKCPICLYVAVSPIMTCKTGHIVCGICCEGVERCPSCYCDGLLQVNQFIERILKEQRVRIPCRNESHGCKLKIQPCLMKRHLNNTCDFRQIQCNELTLLGNCDKRKYHPTDLVKHWIHCHYIEKLVPVLPPRVVQPTTIVTRSKRRRIIKVEEDCEAVQLKEKSSKLIGSVTVPDFFSQADCINSALGEYEPTTWPPQYFGIGQETFVLHSTGTSKNFHSWITLMGSEMEAKKYKFSATVQTSDFGSGKKIKYEGIPIHSVRYCEVERVEPLGHTAILSYGSLKMFDNKTIKEEFAVELNLRFEIFKA